MKASSAVAIAINIGAIALGIYIVSYATVPLQPMRTEGDGLVAYDPEIGMIAKPNSTTRRIDVATAHRGPLDYTVHTNARSARTDHANEQVPPQLDIMTVGCSFSWGHGLASEDTFSSQIGRKLRVRTMNFAMASYGTVQSLQMIRRNRDLAPKIIVYGFIADHLVRNVRACAPSYYPFCLDISHVQRSAGNELQIVPPASDGVRRAILHVEAQSRWLDPFTWTLHGLDVVYGRFTWHAAFERPLPSVDERAAALNYLLAAMRDEARAIGATLIIVHIPTDYEGPPQALTDSIKALDLPFLDLTQSFRTYHAAGGDPYLVDDGHPSAAGHALIADALDSFILRKHLLPLVEQKE